MKSSQLKNTIDRLDSWFDKTPYKGWDPYDIKENMLIAESLTLAAKGHRIGRILPLLCELLPNFSRKLLGTRPQINAKGIGLLAASYARLYQAFGEQHYLDKAVIYMDWLKKNSSPGYSGISWGYPFDWQSFKFIPKGTPSSVVTSTVGEAALLLYQITRESTYLAICENICIFFLTDLRKTVDSESLLCFSYTPIDNFQVHNANLMVGSFVARIGELLGNKDWIRIGERCANFALSEQLDEGWIPYHSKSMRIEYGISYQHHDHYHCGFEIRSLTELAKATHKKAIEASAKKYYQWYLLNLFTDEFVPKISADRLYPINIHSVAEAILCQSFLLESHPARKNAIFTLLDWVEKNMEYRSGEYTYLIKRIKGIKFKQNIAMFRWGQAWMLRALSEINYCCELDKQKNGTAGHLNSNCL
jgi:rhamnogalacturonyl hydrolase YesR